MHFQSTILPILLLAFAAPLIAEERPLLDLPAIEVVSLLGSDDYKMRVAAEHEIARRDFSVLAPLEVALHSPDPEIQMRARRLHRQLDKKFRKVMLTKFANGDATIELPGWHRFLHAVEDTTGTRRLFAQMAEDEWELLESIENSPRKVDYLFYRRAKLLRQHKFGPMQSSIGAGSSAVLLLATCQKDIRISDLSMAQMRYMLHASDLNIAMRDEAIAPAVSKLFDHWIRFNLKEDRFENHLKVAVLSLCIREEIPSGIIMAKAMLEEDSGVSFSRSQPFVRDTTHQQTAMAMLAIAKLGRKSDIAYLKGFLEDDTTLQLMSPNDPFQTQVRDVALVAILALEEKDPKQYGFDRIKPDPLMLYSAHTIGFISDKDRRDAFKSWQASQDR